MLLISAASRTDECRNGEGLEAVMTPEDSAKLPFPARAQLAAAWSRNPKNPPLYLDLPRNAGEPQPDVLAKWRRTHRERSLIDRETSASIVRSRQMLGDKDGLRVDTGKLHDVPDKYGVANSFEVYQGTHTSAVAVRFQNYVLPFFSKNLCFVNICK